MQLPTSSSPLALLPLVGALLPAAAAVPETNWETYTNDLGYTAVRFKDGFEPGSFDYTDRMGGNTTEAVVKRQDNRNTEPLVGSTKIPYGCDTNIQFDVIPKLHDVCSDLGCDSGTTATHDVTWSSWGEETGGTVHMKATGRWPSGMKDAMIEAVQAEVIPEAVEFNEKETRGGGNSPYNPIRIHRCTVSEASNFLSIVVRGDGDALVANLDVEVTFTSSDGTGLICGTVGSAGAVIVGLINGIAGGIFGFVRAIACG